MAKSNTVRAIPEPPVMPWPSLSDEWRVFRDEYLEKEAAFKRVQASLVEAKAAAEQANKVWVGVSRDLQAAMAAGEYVTPLQEQEVKARRERDDTQEEFKNRERAARKAQEDHFTERRRFDGLKGQELQRCHRSLEQTLGREVRDAVRRYVLHVRAFHGVYRPMDYNWWRRTFLGWGVDEEGRQYHALERAVDRYLMED